MPHPEDTGYILLSLMVGDDDRPASDPAAVMERVVDALAGDDDVSEAQLAFSDGQGAYRTYGPSHFGI